MYNKIKNIPFSDVRLYVGDKQGYMNCILYKYTDGNGNSYTASDRLLELDEKNYG